nr:hypothetical protein I308_03420 [Cryptococcus tetragattii IND107]
MSRLSISSVRFSDLSKKGMSGKGSMERLWRSTSNPNASSTRLSCRWRVW